MMTLAVTRWQRLKKKWLRLFDFRAENKYYVVVLCLYLNFPGWPSACVVYGSVVAVILYYWYARLRDTIIVLTFVLLVCII